MQRRVLTAAALLFIGGLGFWFETLMWLTVALVAAMSVACTWEICSMMRKKGFRVYRRVASWGVIALMLEAALTGMEHSAVILGQLVCFAWFVRMWGKVEGAWADVSATCFTLVYVGLPMAAIVRIFFAGSVAEAWLLLGMIVVWATDSFALFTGKALGKHKLWSKISPGKTWEGSIGGVLGAVVAVAIADSLFAGHFVAEGAAKVSKAEWVCFAILFSVLGQIGDLSESLLKRDIGVKDSGRNDWTGHGGFLDMMDAMLFCALPLLAYLRIMHPEALVQSLSSAG